MEGKRHRILGWLDGPRITVVALIIFLILMALFGLKLWVDLSNVVETSNREQVERCYANAVQGPPLRRILRALAELPIDEETRVDLLTYRLLNQQNAPTLRECRELAKSLDVPQEDFE